MPPIPYHSLRSDLYTPGLAPTVFKQGDTPSVSALCAECSRLVYKRFDDSQAAATEVAEALARVGCGEPRFFFRGDAQAFVTTAPEGMAIIAFRGTEPEPRDVLTDLEALLVPWPRGGYVHSGFAVSFQLLWPEIQVLLIEMAMPVLFTGHSLGAALATLAVSGWASKTPARLLTFGSPRVGNGTFVSTLKGVEVSRYVDCCDLVARVPPPGLEIGPVQAGYQHVHEDEPIYIDRHRVVRNGMTLSEIRNDQFHAQEEYILHYAWRLGTVAIRDLADHAPMNYVSPLLA